MKNISGNRVTVEPKKFWEGALIENPPRILFLSGCRTGQMKSIDETRDVESFATLMVDKYKLPMVLGWGRKVNDLLAVYCAEAIYQSIGQGLTILEAVQNARQKMHLEWERISKVSGTPMKPAWPMLRLFCNGMPFNPLLKRIQKEKIEPSNETNDCLPYSKIKVLREGFIGRRTQLQIAMEALEESNYDHLGVLLLGTRGIGKSCLAGKICERFPDHAPIFIEGKLDNNSVKTALQRVFVDIHDEIGLKNLAGNRPITDILADLCVSSFKERNYMLVLDGFEQNLSKTKMGRPGDSDDEASELLNTLLYYLIFCGKASKLIITSRYSFTLNGKGSRNFDERMKRVWLTGFSDLEADRKIQALNPIISGNTSIKILLVKAGSGNPLLIEEIVRMAGEIPPEDTSRLEAEIEKTRESFIREIGLDMLYRQSSESLKKFLDGFNIYEKPVPRNHVSYIAKKAGLNEWQSLLQEGTDLGLVEYYQVNDHYTLTPLLKGELQKINALAENIGSEIIFNVIIEPAEDGVIREWKYDRVRPAPYSINLGKIETANELRLIAQPGNDLTLVANNQLLFYDKESYEKDYNKISQRARIEINPFRKLFNATHETLLLMEEKNKRYNLQLINLDNESIIQSVSVKAFTLCASFGNNAFIIYDRKDGLQVVGPGNEEPRTIIQPDTMNITSLATCPCEKSPNQCRLAVGQENGSITIFNIDLSTWERVKILNYSRHEKAVRYITFIDDHRLVSGGIDRKLFFTELDRNETEDAAHIEFKLHLKCKGMKIDGLQPEKIRLFLEKLIAREE